MSKKDQMFDGEDEPQDEPLKGTDSVGIMKTIKDLDYNEVHAVQAGWVLAFAAPLLYFHGVSYWKHFAGVYVALSASIVGGSERVPVSYVVKEPHYYWLASACGLLSAYLVYVLILL